MLMLKFAIVLFAARQIIAALADADGFRTVRIQTILVTDQLDLQPKVHLLPGAFTLVAPSRHQIESAS
jgi:hypothetical protein